MKQYTTHIEIFASIKQSGHGKRKSVQKGNCIANTKFIQYAAVILVLFTFFLEMNGQVNYKMTKNKWATELNINLFQEDLKLNNAIDQLKIRYSITPDLTARISMAYSSRNSTDIQGEEPSTETYIKSTSNLGFSLGLEKHFEGTGRLSPYIGGECAFGFKRSEYSIDKSNSKFTLNGAWYKSVFSAPGTVLLSDFIERGFSSAGMNLIAGFDFFLSGNLYCGYEMVYTIKYISYSPIIAGTLLKSGTAYNNSTPRLTGSSFEIGPKLLNGIRLGFVF